MVVILNTNYYYNKLISINFLSYELGILLFYFFTDLTILVIYLYFTLSMNN